MFSVTWHIYSWHLLYNDRVWLQYMKHDLCLAAYSDNCCVDRETVWIYNGLYGEKLMVIHITAKILIFLHQKWLASMRSCLFYCHVTSRHNQKPFKWVITEKDKKNRKGKKERQISQMMTSWCGLHFMYATEKFIIIYAYL